MILLKTSLEEARIFVRFADEMVYDASRGESKTYDSRLLYVISGSGKIKIENQSFEIKPGLLLTFQPGTLYKIIPKPSFCAIAVDFDYSCLHSGQTHFYLPVSPDKFESENMHERAFFSDCAALDFYMVLPDAFFAYDMLRELTAEFNMQKIFFRQKCALILKNILFEIARRSTSENKKSKLSDSVVEYIYLNSSSDLSNTSIAKIFNMDPCYLNRVVKSETNISIHQHIIKRRLNNAIKLLLTTSKSVEQIACETGFYNASHFSAACKKITGISPSDYRK